MEVAVAEMIVELAVSEVMNCILATKCCLWSRRKWRKVIGQIKSQEADRLDRITQTLSGLHLENKEKQDILKYAIRITNI